MRQGRILVVEDENAIRHVLTTYLKSMQCEVVGVGSAEEGAELLGGEPFDVALVDIVLPGMNGLEMLARIKDVSPATEVLVMTSHASIDTATEAIRQGAYDYLHKPFDELDEVWDTVKRAIEKKDLSHKNKELLEHLEERNQELSLAVQRRNSLIEAGRAMSSIYKLSELLDFFLQLVVRELNVDRASLMLMDDESREMNIAAAQGIPDEIVASTRIGLGEGVAGKVAETGEPLLVKDIQADPRVSEKLASATADSFVSAPILVSVPIKSRKNVLGVINLTNRRSGKPFTEDDVAYIQGLSGQAAMAIERAKHVTALEKAIETLEETHEQLVATERLRAFGELAAGVAHDFNNILNGVMGRAQSLLLKIEQKRATPEATRSGLKMIESLSLHGALMVKRIQDYTRIRKDRPTEPVDLSDIARTAAAITRPQWKEQCEANGNGIELVMDVDEEVATVGSPSELTQVATNLIMNAVEAMPDGGTLTIKSAVVDDRAQIMISDSGVGMSKEIQEKIFEPFFSTKDQGQGLGASIIYGIVTRHEGEISVESTPGKGTTFVVRLPRNGAVSGSQAPNEVLEMPEPVEAPRAPGREGDTDPACVLVIEDEQQNREMFEEMLSSAGHEVMTAENGEEGIALCNQHAIDVVITDLSMPGMSGWDVSKAVKECCPRTPVILISGWAVQQDQEEAREAGVDYILPKPCPLGDLLSTVETAVGARKAA